MSVKSKNQKFAPASKTSILMEDRPGKLYLKVTLFTTGLGLIGFVSHPFFQAFSFSLLKGIEFTTLKIDIIFKLKLLYIASFVLIPLLVFAIQKWLQLKHIAQNIFLIGSIFVSGIIFWMLQISNLNQQYQDMLKVKTPFPMKYTFAIDGLFLEINLLIGFLVGAIVASVLLYRFKKRSVVLETNSKQKLKK